MDAGVCKPTCNWGHQLVGQTVSKCSTDGNIHGNINGYEWHMGYESLYTHIYIYYEWNMDRSGPNCLKSQTDVSPSMQARCACVRSLSESQLLDWEMALRAC